MKARKILCLLLTLMILAATMVMTVSAANDVIAEGDWGGGFPYWKITGDGTLTLTGQSHIQGSTTGEFPWHKYADKVTKIVIGDGITTIPNSCFREMTRVTTVTIGKKVASIGMQAFRECSSLTSISIPASVKTIKSDAFYLCSALKSVTFDGSSSLTEIENGVFAEAGLETIAIPEGVTTIDSYAFADCKQLKTITLPDSLTTIYSNAFVDCENLTSLNIPRNLYNIVIGAFDRCFKLSHLELDRNVTYSDAFRSLPIESIVVTHDLDTFTGFNGCNTLNSVTLPDTIKTIGDSAFSGCTSLKEINWPASLTTIGKYAFFGSGLTDVVLPDTVTTLDSSAFGSKYLKSFHLNDNVTELPARCLASSSNLTDVYLGNVKTLGTEAFAECTSLVKIDLPDTLETIKDRAFQACTALEGIMIPASVTEIEFSAFSQCSSLRAVYFLGDAPKMGNYMFNFITLNAYYHEGNDTWTEDVMQQYGGNVTWLASDYSDMAPTISAEATAMNSVEIKWTPLPTAARYHVYRAASTEGPYDLVATVIYSHYVDIETEIGETYYYYVVGENAQGKYSEASNTASATTYQITPVVTASNVPSTGKIKLTWDAIPGATGYQIYRATTKDGKYSLMYTAKTTSYTNTNAKAGKYYYYKVVAVGMDGAQGASSNIIGRTCDLPQPDTEISNVAKTGKVRICWIKVDGAVSYKIYRATSKNGTYSLMKTTTSSSYTNTNAVAGSRYYYKVVAVAEKSAANSAAVEMTRTCDLPQVQPAITLNAKGKPNVKWEPVEGAVAYKVYRSTDKSRDYSLTKTLTSTNYVNTSAVKGTTYYYKVVAVCSNSEANSAASNIVSITCTK